VEFLHWLDISCLEDLLNGLYSREPVYPPVAMLKAILLMDLKRMKFFTELARTLKEDPELAEMLGFEKDGIVLIPGYKTLYHFCNIRLKDKWDEIFTILRKNVVSGAIGLSIGKDTVQDATPIRSCNHDDEVEYNAHYKVKGYKVDILTDLKTGIPLSKRVTGINSDEGRDFTAGRANQSRDKCEKG